MAVLFTWWTRDLAVWLDGRQKAQIFISFWQGHKRPNSGTISIVTVWFWTVYFLLEIKKKVCFSSTLCVSFKRLPICFCVHTVKPKPSEEKHRAGLSPPVGSEDLIVPSSNSQWCFGQLYMLSRGTQRRFSTSTINAKAPFVTEGLRAVFGGQRQRFVSGQDWWRTKGKEVTMSRELIKLDGWL